MIEQWAVWGIVAEMGGRGGYFTIRYSPAKGSVQQVERVITSSFTVRMRTSWRVALIKFFASLAPPHLQTFSPVQCFEG
jgi:hypothetical protein